MSEDISAVTTRRVKVVPDEERVGGVAPGTHRRVQSGLRVGSAGTAQSSTCKLKGHSGKP